MYKPFVQLTLLAMGLFIGPCALAESTTARGTIGPDGTRVVSVFDGEFTVRIHPSDAPPGATDYLTKPLAGDHDALARTAESGDVLAALQLAYGLDQCVGRPTSEQALLATVETMVETRKVTHPYYAEPRAVGNIDGWVDKEIDAFGLCEGLTQEQIDRTFEWWALAADLGSYHAQMSAMGRIERQHRLKHKPSQRDTGPAVDVSQGWDLSVSMVGSIAEETPEALDSAIGHLQMAQERGSLSALNALGILYMAEVLDPPNSYSARANAYANFRATTEVWHQIFAARNDPYGPSLVKLANGLSDEEFLWAENQARELLRAENCCRKW